MIDLTDRAELLTVIDLMVDAMRRSDPVYCASHECEPCSDADWDDALMAGEFAMEANETEPDDRQLMLIGGLRA